jgi:threonine/homoserine/homoserine lactone efflux protein
MGLVTSPPAFVVAVVLISASSGPAMALIFRRAPIGGYGGSIPIVLGLEAGVYLWALAAVAGLATLVAASQVAFVVSKSSGGRSLVLGIRSWRQAWRTRGVADDPPIDTEAQHDLCDRGKGVSFMEGLIFQLAYPEAAVFMVALYPQFVPADRTLFTTTGVLAVLQVGIQTILYLGLAAGVGRARG